MVIKDSGMAQFGAMGVYKGFLYAGTENWSLAGATRIYEVQGTIKINSLNLPTDFLHCPSDDAITPILWSLFAKSRTTMLIETDNAQVWTYDGSTFTDITPAAGAFSANKGAYSGAALNNQLFVGTGSDSATAQVWAYDGVNWTQQIIPGFSSNNRYVWSMKVYKNALYLGTVDYSDGAQIWRYDGSTWTMMSIPGFSGGNYAVASMTVYNGSLFIGTSSTAPAGAEVWKYDGSTWAKLTGFSKNDSVTSMAKYNGALFIGTTNYTPGAAGQLWAYDGTNWMQLNITGFSSDNSGIVSMAAYNGSLYFGTYSTTGAELWYVTAAGYNSCTATLSSDLTLSVPILSYGGQSYWAIFGYVPNTLDVALLDAGLITDTSPFSGCTPAMLSASFQLHIPAVFFDGVSYWADFQYDQGLNLKLTGAGTN